MFSIRAIQKYVSDRVSKHSVIFISILIVASILRTGMLESVPHGFHNDEASFYINAVSIKQSGKDEDGRLLPLYLHSYIDPKPALFSYIQIPFLTVLGSTQFAARLPSALFGIFSVVLLYYICKNLHFSDEISLLATSLLAISPWHINLSRSTQEVIMSFFSSCFHSFSCKSLSLQSNGRKRVSILSEYL